MNKVAALSLVMLSLSVGWSCEKDPSKQQPPPVAIKTTSDRLTPVTSRPCRKDMFFIDMPFTFTSSVPWRNEELLPALEYEVLHPTNQGRPPEFEEFRQAPNELPKPCKREVVAEALPLLDERVGSTIPHWRRDGHLRFYRVRFRCGKDGPLLNVKDDYQCQVVWTLKRFFELKYPWLRPPYVGRECDAPALQASFVPSATMIQSSRTLLGSFKVARASPVGVALIDSGVALPTDQASVSSNIGVSNVNGQRDFTDDPFQPRTVTSTDALHGHGTAMALIINEVAPNAAIESIRVVGTDGTATGAAVARALDYALFAAEPFSVINLSLGWPHQLGTPSPMDGGIYFGQAEKPEIDCSRVDIEGPFGEPVYYLLRQGGRPGRTLISAATGNVSSALAGTDSSIYPPDLGPMPITLANRSTCPEVSPRSGLASHVRV